MLDKGIDFLVYQGNLDLYFNTVGNLRWAEDVLWKGQAEFRSQSKASWQVRSGTEAGWFKEIFIRRGDAGGKTRFSFVTLDGAGHFAPADKPEAALDMLTKWLHDQPFS